MPHKTPPSPDLGKHVYYLGKRVEESQQGSDFKKSSSKVKKGISKADRSSEDKYSKKKTNIKGKDDESTDDEKTSESKKTWKKKKIRTK